MIKASDVTKAAKTLLETTPAFEGYTIERSERINEDAAAIPWVGIYRGDTNYSPRTLGTSSKSWRAIVEIVVRVQRIGGTAEETEDNLEESIQAVLDAFLANATTRTVNGTVDAITGFEVSYFGRDDADEKTSRWQMAEVVVTCEKRTG